MQINLINMQIAQARACLSVNDLVEKTGLSRATITKTINGTTKPTPKTLGLLAKTLGVDVIEILSNEN